MMNIQYLIKALFAGVTTFLGSLLAVMQVPEAVGVTAASWVAIALATVLAVGGVLGLQAAPSKIATSTKSE